MLLPSSALADASLHDNENIYVAKDNSVQQLFFVIGGELHKPFIVSSKAAEKQVSGNFDLSKPAALFEMVATRTGLIWYDDGSAIYVYDASEIQSSIVRLMYAPFDALLGYLKSTGLYDKRFPVRSDSDGDSGSFYVSGPPVYVQLVQAAAKYMDATYARPESGETTIRVIKLKNTFVNDRKYTQRGKTITIPGVATVLNQLIGHANGQNNEPADATISVDDDTRGAIEETDAAPRSDSFPFLSSLNQAPVAKKSFEKNNASDQSINIVGYSDTNSLLVEGSERQVSFVEDLVRAIDVPKRQIQLSLWIIDISKEDINELGIKWQGAAKISNNGVTFNTSSLTPENSIHFLADISALAQKGNAQIVSRPEILTQDNVPALFDNNSSFYAKLLAERTASLKTITYGTMISVLPRLAEDQHEIEMILNIQDGGLEQNNSGDTQDVDQLPVVSNTQISTEARVPNNYSLLVGGYSRDEDEHHDFGIPGLRDIPYLGRLFNYSYTSHQKMVRVFLIQPKLLRNDDTWNDTNESNPVLGRTVSGGLVTLKSTVAMLRSAIGINKERDSYGHPSN
ncbi:type III secretion system outer membrane ring subunit SctC [Izhakiella capsodis]|nr:type III secretion system outer membrane ring subunit SctC [Izhakiella capsodis]